MTYEESLKKNESALRNALSRADDADRIRKILEDHFSRSLLSFTQECQSDSLCASAAAMTGAARAALGLVDSAGEVTFWRRMDPSGYSASSGRKTSSGRFAKAGLRFWFFLICGILLLAVPAILSASSLKDPVRLLIVLLMAAGGGFCLFLAGIFRHAGGKSSDPDLIPRITYDSDRILRQVRQIAITIDRTLADQSLAEQSGAGRKGIGGGSAPEPGGETVPEGSIAGQEDLLTLFSSLLEAYYSQDGQYALDELASVRHYLHWHGADAVDYVPQHRDWFDFIPASEAGTLRPAIVQSDGGKLLKKGLACDRHEE